MRYRHLPLGRRLLARAVTESTETLIAGSCLFGSVPRLFGGSAPLAVEEVFPQWLTYAWGAVLVIGGAGLLAGILSSGHRLERPALSLIAGASLAYAAAILGFQGFAAGSTPAAVNVAVAAMCVISLDRQRLINWLTR